MREDPLIKFDMVQHRAKTPVLNQGVTRHLTVVDHACKNTHTQKTNETNTLIPIDLVGAMHGNSIGTTIAVILMPYLQI